MMFGFIVGTACLIGLIRVLRAPHWSGRMGWGRRGRILGRIFSRLETSPSQENVIVDAISDVRAGGRKAMPELAATRAQVAEILRAETFDPALLEPTPGGVSLLARSSMIDDEEEDGDALGFTKLMDSHLPDADDDE